MQLFLARITKIGHKKPRYYRIGAIPGSNWITNYGSSGDICSSKQLRAE